MKSVIRKAKTIREDEMSLRLKSLTHEKSKIESKTDREDQSETFRRRRMDPLTEHLGCTSYYHKMRWPWLVFKMGTLSHSLEVDRYYHEKKLAIDIGKINVDHKEQKKDLFESRGIKYIVLENALDMKSLAMGLS